MENCMQTLEKSIKYIDPEQQLKEEKLLTAYASSFLSNLAEDLLTWKWFHVYKAFLWLHELLFTSRWTNQISTLCSTLQSTRLKVCILINMEAFIMKLQSQKESLSLWETNIVRLCCNRQVAWHLKVFIVVSLPKKKKSLKKCKVEGRR